MPITDETVDKYASLFCPYYLHNYGVQHDHNGNKWNYKRKNNCGVLVRGHLEEIFWLAFPPTWYIPFGYIDCDDPLKSPLKHALELLHFNDSERLIMSSPGYLKNGCTHTIWKPRYKGNIMTRKLFQDIYGPRIKNTGNELFPWKNRLFRSPAGRDQYILDENGIPLELCPEEFMYWVDKIDPFETTEKISYQTSFLPELYSDKIEPKAFITATSEEARRIEKYGLQKNNTRHDHTLTLAIEYYKLDWPPEKAIRTIKSWIRRKNNGYSNEFNKNRLWFIDKEIIEIVTWVYENFTGVYHPNSIHNFLTGLTSPDDVKFASDIFRGDWINIKRTIALFQYCRPRSFFPWIYIPFRIWSQISSRSNYIDFQNDLSRKGIIKNVRTSYSVGRYSKSFQIAFPGSFRHPITNDNRAETDTGNILLRTFGTVRNAVEATGINRQSAWRVFN